MPLSVILVLLSILISLSPTTSPTSPAPALCTYVIFAAFDPFLALKLPPPLPPPVLHRSLKIRLQQLPLSQPRLHPRTASPAYPKLTRSGCYQNAQTLPYHSCS